MPPVIFCSSAVASMNATGQVAGSASLGLYGVNAADELRKVQDRAPIERSLMVQP